MMTSGKAIYGFSAVMGLAFLGVLGVPTEPAGAIENYDHTNEQMGSDDPNAACKDKHAPCSDKSSFTMLQSYQMASKILASVDNDLDSDQIKPQQLAEAEKKYADLAEKCVANESALSANVIRAVDGMKRELGAVWMYINTTHIADVSRSSHSLQRYNKCNSDMNQALDVGGVVRNWMDETTQAETQHNNCKAGEALLYDVMVDAKSSMETAILASNADECAKQFLPSKLFNPKPKVECIKKVVKWAERSNKSLVEAYAKFVAANEGHETKRNECTTMQHQFEAKFCEFSTAYKDACSARTACENAARKDYDQMKAEVKKTMQIRKSDFVAATHIDCYLGVILLAHNAENGVGLQGKLKECQNRVIDTSELDLVVVDLPENTPCDMTPTAPEPGETGWAKKRYENKEWYKKASPIDSVNCIPTPAPTTIPTPTPPTPASNELVCGSPGKTIRMVTWIGCGHMDCFGFVYSDGTSENSCGGRYAGLDTAGFCRNGCTNCGAGDYYCQNGVCDGKLTLPTGEYITELTQYTNAGSASAQLSATGLRVKTSAGKDTLLKGHGYTEENPNVVTGSLTFNSKTLQTVAGESCGQAAPTPTPAGGPAVSLLIASPSAGCTKKCPIDGSSPCVATTGVDGELCGDHGRRRRVRACNLAQQDWARGATVHPDGDIITSDYSANRVMKCPPDAPGANCIEIAGSSNVKDPQTTVVDADGSYLILGAGLWRCPADGSGPSSGCATLIQSRNGWYGYGLTVHPSNGDLVIGSRMQHVLRRCSPTINNADISTCTIVAGKLDELGNANTHLNQCFGAAITADGEYIISSYGNGRIVKCPADGSGPQNGCTVLVTDCKAHGSPWLAADQQSFYLPCEGSPPHYNTVIKQCDVSGNACQNIDYTGGPINNYDIKTLDANGALTGFNRVSQAETPPTPAQAR